MASYAYEAVDPSGLKTEGLMDVTNQNEALRRIKEMGLYPTRVTERRPKPASRAVARPKPRAHFTSRSFHLPWLGGRVKPRVLAVFTRQLATCVEAGMPLLRGLRLLEQQETHRMLKRIIGEVGASIEGGGTLTEAVSAHPKVFNPLYVNMVKAGEVGGALDVTLRRLAEFMEKAQKIKGKVKAAMFYPAAVLSVATGILVFMTLFIVPRFQQVFEGLVPGGRMPPFTLFVIGISDAVRHHVLPVAAVLLALVVTFALAVRTTRGRWMFDRLRLSLPPVGKLFCKLAIARFARTLGTLLGNGVPILQALNIVKETAGNVVVGRVISTVHDSVKQGDTVAGPLKASGVFPPVVAGMVDVGEQTGALPDMLLKIADNCDDDVDNAVSAMTSLLEPIMIVFLALVVGSIVIALFLPILAVINPPPGGAGLEP